MSLKSDIQNMIQETYNGYVGLMEGLEKVFKDDRLTEKAKREIELALQDKFDNEVNARIMSLEPLCDEAILAVKERDAEEISGITNTADYQSLLGATLNQLPEIMECSEQIIKAKLAPFANDPIARKRFIDKLVPLKLLPECHIGRGEEMLPEVKRYTLNVLRWTANDSLTDKITMNRNAHYEKAGLNGGPELSAFSEWNTATRLKSFHAYFEGFNDDCTDFDPEKIDLEAAAAANMITQDFAGAIAKKYGGKETYDVIEARDKDEFARRFINHEEIGAAVVNN